MPRQLIAVALGVLLLTATAAFGQTAANISVGVDYGVDVPASDRVEAKRAWGIAFRLPRPGGWSFAWDFGALESDLAHQVAGAVSSIGAMTVRPVLAGGAYTWSAGRFEASALLTGGVAFVGVDLGDEGRARLRDAFRVADVHADGGPAVTVQPKLTVWYDINQRFGLTASAAYLHLRPRLTLAHDADLEEFTINASMTRISAGVVFKIY